LESFNVLAGWGAFAGGRTSSLPAWDDDQGHAFLIGRAEGERDVEVQVKIGTRMTLRAANERTTYSELRLLLPSLSFLARDIDLLDGSPSVRRLFMDKLCALSFPLYARRLAEYKQLVRNRTALLRQGRWNDAAFRATAFPIARLGGWIRVGRQKIIGLLSEALLKEREMLPFEVEMALELHGTLESQESKDTARAVFEEAASEEAVLKNAMSDLAAALAASAERERAAGRVFVGPQVDDLLLTCLGRPAALSLSRGQKRRVVVAMILSAGRLIEAKLRLRPILLLDDVAAELDGEGRELMGHVLSATGWQVFVTGAEDPFKIPGSAVWRVRDGEVRE
jgi:DNA replication and repair protein RecF